MSQPPTSKKRRLNHEKARADAEAFEKDLESNYEAWQHSLANWSPPSLATNETQADREKHELQQRLEKANALNDELKTENERLRLEKRQLQTDVERLQKLTLKMEEKDAKLKEMELTQSSLKMCLKGLAQLAKNRGFGPDFGQVRMLKMAKNRYEQGLSASVHEIQQSVAQEIHKEFGDNGICVEPIVNESVAYHNFEWIETTELSNRLRIYYTTNMVADAATVIHVDTKEAASEDCHRVLQSKLVEIYTLDKDYRVSALANKGEKGLRAKSSIPRGTVIGMYTGNVYTQQEFKDVFSQTNQEAIRNIYAFDITAYAPKSMRQTTEDDQKSKQKEKNDYFYERNCDAISLVIDGFDHMLENKNPMTFLNDCREDILIPTPTEEDEKHWNCEFRVALVNGFPMVFIISCKAIEARQPLSIFYCPEYGMAVRELKQQHLELSRICGFIDHVLKLVGLQEEDERESYCL